VLTGVRPTLPTLSDRPYQPVDRVGGWVLSFPGDSDLDSPGCSRVGTVGRLTEQSGHQHPQDYDPPHHDNYYPNPRDTNEENTGHEHPEDLLLSPGHSDVLRRDSHLGPTGRMIHDQDILGTGQTLCQDSFVPGRVGN